MKKIKFFIFSSVMVLFFACDSTELDLLVDPDSLSPENADIGQVFNATQLGLADFFEVASTPTMDLTRMTNMSSGNAYANAYLPDDFNTIWEVAYATFLADVSVLKQISTDDENPNMLAVAQTMEAYVIITLADLFGDIPYSQALQQGENFNPERDSDESIYIAARDLLLSARGNYDEDALPLINDLYYNNDISKWERLTNSLLLKIAVNSRLANPAQSTSDVQGLLNQDLIENSSDDFEFEWSTNVSSPASRHPKFASAYDAPTPTGFQSNNYMWLLQNDKDDIDEDIVDPRIRYYFYRKTLETPTSTNQVGCLGSDPFSHYVLVGEAYPFCTAGNGYVGRDHGNNGPILSDGAVRTIYGLYPVGGKFDDNSASQISMNSGAAGAGISPIMTSSFVEFMRAEAQLTLLNNPAAARNNLENGIRESIADVTGTFDSSLIDSDFAPTGAEIDAYVNAALQLYDNASGTDNKLNVIIKEYYFALFGNGIETFNNYRRTGKPENLQPSINSSPGTFFNLLWYPTNHTSFNNNADPRPNLSEKAFWAENTSFNLNF